jgi:hypothetical protein
MADTIEPTGPGPYERARLEDERRRRVPDDRDEELRELRDLGGEDVRVAMMRRLRLCHMGLTCHTPNIRP